MAIKKRDPDRHHMYDITLTWNRKRPTASPTKRQWCNGEKEFSLTSYWGGTPAPDANRTRCPKCNRPLFLQEIHCIGGELLGYRLPPHKTKVKTTRRPSRQSSKRMGRKGRK